MLLSSLKLDGVTETEAVLVHFQRGSLKTSGTKSSSKYDQIGINGFNCICCYYGYYCSFEAFVELYYILLCIFGVCQKHKTPDEKIGVLSLLLVHFPQHDYEQMSVFL